MIAPVRSWRMGRDEEAAYARRHGIPVKGGSEVAPYSIDDNLWGRSSEGRWIEDLEHAPDDDVFQLVTRPELAPDEPEVVELEFERGVPVALNGERLDPVALIERAGEIGARHGVGIVDHIEDRIVGLKVRDIYEVPAAAIILLAHQELEKLVGTIHQNQLKPTLDQHWAYLVYAGLWWEPLRTDLDAYMDAANALVTGHDRDQALQGLGPGRDPVLAPRRLRRPAGHLLRVRRAVLAGGLAGLHRALVAAVADGLADPPRPRDGSDPTARTATARRPTARPRETPDGRASGCVAVAGRVASRAWVTRFSASSSGRAASGTCGAACPALAPSWPSRRLGRRRGRGARRRPPGRGQL